MLGRDGDMVGVVALDEGGKEFEVVGLVGVESRAGDGEHVDDFSGVLLARDVVDGARRVEFDQSFEGGGQAGKLEAGGGGFHRCFFQLSRSYSLCVRRRIMKTDSGKLSRECGTI